MKARHALAAAAFAVATLLVTSCGSSSGSGGTTPGSPTPAATTASAATVKVVQDPTYGAIVVDAAGNALYLYDKDTASPSVSNCTGGCLKAWPAATVTGTPTGTGITGTLGTITRTDDGTTQITLAGWPLYRYAKDSKPGDTTGQAVGGIWWLDTPDGKKIATVPSASASH